MLNNSALPADLTASGASFMGPQMPLLLTMCIEPNTGLHTSCAKTAAAPIRTSTKKTKKARLAVRRRRERLEPLGSPED